MSISRLQVVWKLMLVALVVVPTAYCETEPNDTIANANVVQVNSSVSGSLTAEAPHDVCDFYKVTLPNDGMVQIGAEPTAELGRAHRLGRRSVRAWRGAVGPSRATQHVRLCGRPRKDARRAACGPPRSDGPRRRTDGRWATSTARSWTARQPESLAHPTPRARPRDDTPPTVGRANRPCGGLAARSAL